MLIQLEKLSEQSVDFLQHLINIGTVSCLPEINIYFLPAKMPQSSCPDSVVGFCC